MKILTKVLRPVYTIGPKYQADKITNFKRIKDGRIPIEWHAGISIIFTKSKSDHHENSFSYNTEKYITLKSNIYQAYFKGCKNDFAEETITILKFQGVCRRRVNTNCVKSNV